MAKKANLPKVATASADLVAERLAALRALVPEAFTEGKLDTDKLRAAVGDISDAGTERYSFSWAGKRDAIRLLQMPSRATLVPCPKESVEWEKTQNLFIEGDNLEVLKLLYKPYAGRVKLIYIDPPYNTGNDFIYPDDFTDPLDTYLKLTGQKDANGNLLTSNPESNGRYHSTWLSMIYPRLFVARQLLRDDGAIFISIDDREFPNLRLAMNEVFGEENFLAVFVRKRRMATGMRGEPVSPDHEYIVAYAKSLPQVKLYGKPKNAADYPYEDGTSRYRSTDLTIGMTKEMRPNQWYALTNPKTKSEYLPADGRVWRFEPTTMQQQITDENIIWPEDIPDSKMTRPRFKTRYRPDSAIEATSPVSTWINGNSESDENGEETREVLTAGLNQEGTKELRELFGEQVLEYPKPVSLMSAIVSLASRSDDIVMDFFAGSASTAHAVLESNRSDGHSRRFIMVQFPEPTAEDSTARQAGFKTIAAISAERIRRVIKQLKKDAKGKLELKDREQPEDLGFRLFKLTESHYRQWSGVDESQPEAWAKQMEMFVDPLLPGWDALAVVYEIAAKEGYVLTSKVEKLDGKALKDNTIYSVTDADRKQSFRICLDDKLDARVVKALNLSKDDLFICRDVALTDELAANMTLQCRLKTI
jgi:adenine-specific DNA-methyltransferase